MTDFKSLPVYQSKQKILDALKTNQVVIVESPTGSGKTTQIPLILYEAGYTNHGKIGVTQPRRIATLSVSSFINKQIEKDHKSQGFCAYKMRFYDTTNCNTKIKILTDGMLLQEVKTDPQLSDYSVLMIDEAHERSLNIDFLLGILKKISAVRTDLKIIISSATINTSVFSKFFNNAPVISIKTKIYNVSINYLPLKSKNDIDEISHSICQIVNSLIKKFKTCNYSESFDTLIFLPGEFDIKYCNKQLYEYCDYSFLQIYMLYGRLNKDEQERVFEDTQDKKIKIVLATNIAETSLTIDNIKVVIDSGLAKINYYNQFDFTSSLLTKSISKASAKQRAGRAGRTSDGTCFRLYSEEEYNNKTEFTPEEILRTDLSEVVLRMIDLNIKDFENFPFILKPEKRALISGEQTLLTLDAIDNNRKLTQIGKLMTLYPLLPKHARCIVHSINHYPQVISNVCICISFLSCKTPFLLPQDEEDSARIAHKKFSSQSGDFIGYQYLYYKYVSLNTTEKREDFCKQNYLDFQSMEEIVHVTNQLYEITRKIGLPVVEKRPDDSEEFVRECIICLASGLIQFVCMKKRGSVYRTVNTDEIFLHPGSAYFKNLPLLIVAGEIVFTSKMYARTVSVIKKQWLDEIDDTLYDKLKKSISLKEENKTKTTDKTVSKIKTYSLFGYSYPVKSDDIKCKKPVVIIPSDDIKNLYKTYQKSKRRPKNICATIQYKGYFVNYGESLYEVLSIGNKLDYNSEIVKSIPLHVFYNTDNFDQLTEKLQLLLKLSPLTKYKDRLGYVELITTKSGVYFHVNKSFNEAINNTAYSLLTITDYSDNKNFSKSYNRLIHFLD